MVLFYHSFIVSIKRGIGHFFRTFRAYKKAKALEIKGVFAFLITFREEIPTAARRIEAADGGEFLLQGLELFRARLDGLFLHGGVEFFFVGVEEQRVDDFVDVLDARVVHAARAARGRVQRALEDGAEDGRGDLAPVEVAGILEDEAAHRIVHRRHGDALGEEAAVDVGKGGEAGLEEGIARLRFLV